MSMTEEEIRLQIEIKKKELKLLTQMTKKPKMAWKSDRELEQIRETIESFALQWKTAPALVIRHINKSLPKLERKPRTVKPKPEGQFSRPELMQKARTLGIKTSRSDTIESLIASIKAIEEREAINEEKKSIAQKKKELPKTELQNETSQ